MESHDLSRYAVPKQSAPFRPRADADLLSRALQNAWAEYQESLFPEERKQEVSARLTAALKERFPAADMATLARYGTAKPTTHATVAIYVKGRNDWSESAAIELTEPVLAPDNYNACRFSTGPIWSSDPNLGCTPAYVASLSAEKFNELRQHHIEREANYVPADLFPFFDSIVEARRAFTDQYRVATDWPEQEKKRTGQWPTWEQIESAFPLLGGYMQRLRAPMAQAA